MTELTGPTNLIEGQSAHMEARIEPYPDANMKVEWFHNGKPLAMGKSRLFSLEHHFHYSGTGLQLHNLQFVIFRICLLKASASLPTYPVYSQNQPRDQVPILISVCVSLSRRALGTTP